MIAPIFLAFGLGVGLTLGGPPAPLVAAIPALGVAAPAPAYAGELAVMSCSANGAAAPIEGWTSAGAGDSSGAYNQCASGGVFGAAISEAAPQPADETISWTYTPPPWARIAGGTISGGLVIPYGQGGTAYFAAPTASYDQGDVLGNCQWNLACPQSAAAPGPGSYAGTWPIRPGGDLYAVVTCSGLPGGTGCPGGFGPPATAAIIIATATIELTTTATPAAGGFGGGLLAPGPVSGTQPLTFTATEPNGPGIATVTVAVDTTPVYSGTPDANGGKCANVGTDPSGVPEYLSPTPCLQSLAVDLPVKTTTLPDGAHQLHVSVTDAAGVTSHVLNQPFTTTNRTNVSAQLNNSPAPSGAADSAAPLYAIALDPTSQPLIPGVKRPFAHSALNLSGGIRTTQGLPAPGVALTLLAQNGGVGDPQPIARATSDAAGHWTLSAPRGPTRILTITYGAQPQATAAQNAVTIKETVTPGVSLHITALSRARVRFSGKLNANPLGNPRPTILVQALVRHHWQSIGHTATVTPAGTYRLTYSARPAVHGKFAFRAITLPTSLYTAATSATRTAMFR